MSINHDFPDLVIDESLGEKLYPDEAALTRQIAAEVEKGIRAQYQPGSARRDVHAKATGTMKAEFRIHDTLPPGLAKGIFVPGKVYEAILRFSNGSGDPRQQADGNDDGRGLAIKILGVTGKKILETEADAASQDFVLINRPFFFTSDPHTYLTLIQKANGNLLTKLTIPLSLGLERTRLLKQINSGKISNPLQIQYFSASAFQHGPAAERQVVKYSVKPVLEVSDDMPENPGHDFLTEAMKTTLRKGDVIMKFLIQPRTSEALSVEDCMHEWREEQAPFHEVATLRIPSQDFDTHELRAMGEVFSFNPCHALPDHRPLGCVNRMRKVVYEHISQLRNRLNSQREEP